MHDDTDGDLVDVLVGKPVACRLWPEQTEGPYRRDVHLDRRDITEDRQGLPLRLALRLLDAETGTPLIGAWVEIWQADYEGRYSGFEPFSAKPGEVVTSESVPRDVVAPAETFLRGGQSTDDRGVCVFATLFPGWYSSRTVHIHLVVEIGDRRAVTQLYFPDELTDEVFTHPPYAGRPPRDTTNATDSIFADGGERTVLHLDGDVHTGLTGMLCLEVSPPPAASTPPSSRADVADAAEIRAAVEAHVAAVGMADADAVGALYAPQGQVFDPTGGVPVTGRFAITEHFKRVLTEPRDMQIVKIIVTGHPAAVHFRATPAGGSAREIIDTMAFDDQGLITVMCVYAD